MPVGIPIGIVSALYRNGNIAMETICMNHLREMYSNEGRTMNYSDQLYGYSRTNDEYHNQYSAPQSLLQSLRTYVQRQPELALAGALVGGYLLARYLNRDSRHITGPNHQPEYYRPIWADAPRQPHSRYPASRPMAQRPADHMGATEVQMSNDFAEPSEADLEQGAAGTTGAVYEMDKDSITAG